jgi:mRNA interferase RelE/StbE
MKNYKLLFDKRYLKELEAIERRHRDLISKKVEALASDPRPFGSIKLSGSKNPILYRLRCGDYRILYTIEDDVLIVLIMQVGIEEKFIRVGR